MIESTSYMPTRQQLYAEAQKLFAMTKIARVGAIARLRRAGQAPDLVAFSLAQALDCVAREWLFEDWNALSKHFEGELTKPIDVEAYFHHLLADEIRVDSEEFRRASEGWREALGTRLALLDDSLDIEEIVANGVNEPIAPLGISALVYLCCSRIGATNSVNRALRRTWVNRLLAAGADPSAGMREMETIRGFRSCLGGSIGFSLDTEITSALLKAGADIEDGPTLYEGSAMWEAIRQQDLRALDLLIAAKPPEWHLCHALTHSFQFHNEQIVEKLLEAGADPNWTQTIFGMKGSALHEAIHCNVDMSLFRRLVEAKADIDANDAGQRNPLSIATALCRMDLARELVSNSSDTLTEVGPIESFVGVCLREDEDEMLMCLEELKSLETLDYHQQLWLHEVIKRGSHEALDWMLQLPLDFDTIDYQGQTALHVAVQMGDTYAIDRLLSEGAKCGVTDFDGDTVVEMALRSEHPSRDHTVDLLAERLSEEEFDLKGTRLRLCDRSDFEMAATAISTGDATLLAKLLDEHLYFNKARSPRPHRCTLLNYIGVNGFEGERQISPDNAVEIIELLLARGSDPNAVCYTYRGGPGETTLGLLLSSGVVSSAKQKTAMTRALVRGGADIDAAHALFFRLLDAQESNEVDSVLAELDLDSQLHQEIFFVLASNHEFKLMQRLLDAGSNVNCTNGFNQTALHWAALEGDEELVDWLLEHGADSTIRETQFGGTGSGWADAGDHQSLAKKLAGIEQAKS